MREREREGGREGGRQRQRDRGRGREGGREGEGEREESQRSLSAAFLTEGSWTDSETKESFPQLCDETWHTTPWQFL